MLYLKVWTKAHNVHNLATHIYNLTLFFNSDLLYFTGRLIERRKKVVLKKPAVSNEVPFMRLVWQEIGSPGGGSISLNMKDVSFALMSEEKELMTFLTFQN